MYDDDVTRPCDVTPIGGSIGSKLKNKQGIGSDVLVFVDWAGRAVVGEIVLVHSLSEVSVYDDEFSGEPPRDQATCLS